MLGDDGSGKFYCGRKLGMLAIPLSDGQCGPNGGPQCGSCKRFRQMQNDEGAPVNLGNQKFGKGDENDGFCGCPQS